MKQWREGSGLVTRLGRVPLICLLALAGSAALAGCSSDAAVDDAVGQTGTLGVALEVAPGVTLNSVTYVITRGEFEKTGSIDISGSPSISGTIGGIPAATGYTITLSASSVEDGTTFTGSANFDVAAGKTSSVKIHLRGAGTSGNGSVTVNGTLNLAPVIDELSIAPLEVYVGSSLALTAVASDADAGPSALTYYWSTTGGVIDDPIAPNARLTSATPGTFTVQLTVSDGDSTTTTSSNVTFVPRADGGGGSGGGGGSAKPPNVLFIIVDDLGSEATSLYPELAGDSGAVPIPNIEALAEDGLVFDNAWASPVCSPTRGTIISGQYGHRTGVTTVGNVLPTDTVTLFDRVSADSPADYGQAFFGKYHVGGGNRSSVDPLPGDPYPEAPGVLQHVRELGIPYFKGILAGGVNDYFNWTTYDINAPESKTTKFATSALTDYAIDYIHEHEATKPDEPWFVYQAYNAPHAVIGGNTPFQVPPAELHSVDLSSVGNPAPGTIVTNIPVYKALIQSLDTEIGRLLKEVDLDDTVVIFVGDNGTPSSVKDSGTGIRSSKGSVYEGGVRVPLVVAGAGVTRRGREDDLFVTTDVYASILDLAGVAVSHVNNSYSFEPLLSDETATNGRTHSFTEVSSGTSNRSYALKDKRFKLLSTSRRWELYDLVADPLETTNLYANEAYAAVVANLKGEIAELRAEALDGYFPE